TTFTNGGAGYGDGGTTGFQDVSTGSHTAREARPGHTDLANYSSSTSCAINGGSDVATDTVNLTYGDSAVCTITNSRLPQINIVKDFVGGNTTVDLKDGATVKKTVTADDSTGLYNTTTG